MASNIEEILLTITIDTECDHDARWVRSNPLRFESVLDGLPNRLQPAFTELGAIPTYLLTVEVMEDSNCVDVLRSLPGQFEFGTHLHAAFVEPQKKFYNYAGIDSADFQSSYAPDIEYQKLDNLTQLFSRTFGYSPTSFRAGRYGAGADSLNSLQKLGYKVDTSVTPHIRWVEPNGVVDFRTAPEQPYFPARDSVVEPGGATPERILEVPITVRRRRFRRTPTWFRPWFASVNEMKQMFHYYVNTYSEHRVLSINMMFHSMEVIEKASPYPQTPGEVARFLDDMSEVLAWCRQEGASFRSLSSLHDTFLTADGRA